MSNDQIIENKVEEYVNRNEAFTSVDIANAIKIEGTWIRNREVAAWLRHNLLNITGNNYQRTLVDVGQGRQASLYHPFFFDSSNYIGQNQNALNPDDFNALHPNGIIGLSKSYGLSDASNENDEEEDFNEDSRTVSVTVGRVWIPATIIAQLGMKPGEDADNGKLNLINSSNLTVHDDGRVSVTSKNINASFQDGDKIKIFVKDNVTIYEKQ